MMILDSGLLFLGHPVWGDKYITCRQQNFNYTHYLWREMMQMDQQQYIHVVIRTSPYISLCSEFCCSFPDFDRWSFTHKRCEREREREPFFGLLL